MDQLKVSRVNDVILNRRGYNIAGTLILSSYHLVFSFPNTSNPTLPPREIWICYPIIEKISKSRGSSWINNDMTSATTDMEATPPPTLPNFDHYSASHIRIQCRDFTFYSFDFLNDEICCQVFNKLSSLITVSKTDNDIMKLYALQYQANVLEQATTVSGWDIYDPIKEYTRLGLIDNTYWRISNLNQDYKFCPSYPKILIVPNSISDNVLKHAGKFRSKQRIPAIVYKHRANTNGNVIARCSQPLVGLNLQNRSIQDEKLIGEIFKVQQQEQQSRLSDVSQPQRNLLVDLRPITNAMAQHALGAGTENIENYRGKLATSSKSNGDKDTSASPPPNLPHVEKIFCNIDNIHVMRDSVNKLTSILNDLDKYPLNKSILQQQLIKTQWLHRLSLILQSVDRITKSIHFNNTNVIIHCSDGWDRTSQVSALAQLCLDPYYRTIPGFMVLIEKEWISFGFKFNTRADHGGCIGAIVKKEPKNKSEPMSESSSVIENESVYGDGEVSATASVTSFLQRAAKAARDIKNSAQNGLSSPGPGDELDGKISSSIYGGSSEKSPIFHQFLDCVYQIYRQHPTEFQFNSRFLKRLIYHYYSCQYGTFLCDSERELYQVYKLQDSTVSIWDYFNSRLDEFTNSSYKPDEEQVIFFNFVDVKWWFELYGRTDEEMNGLSNSLDRKFAQMNLGKK
ncbi:Phosphoinositide 3-phosphatase [Spathaspora sp. JA1]|nr:Phosphoinositide 3-phosphatase [Spathaspora sp. JA1]